MSLFGLNAELAQVQTGYGHSGYLGAEMRNCAIRMIQYALAGESRKFSTINLIFRAIRLFLYCAALL